MKKTLIISLLMLFAFKINAQIPEGINIAAVSKGGITGDLLELTVANNTDKLYYHTLNPFVYYTADHSQALIFPFGKIISVEPGENKKILLNGYTVFVDRPPLEPHIEISGEKIINLAALEMQSYIESEYELDKYKTQSLKRAELIPFDFILTKPGTFRPLSLTMDIFENQELANIILIEQARLLHRAFERLYIAGQVITHFNNDPLIEKDLMIQHAIWICAAGLEGKVLKKNRLNNTFFDVYSSISKDMKKMTFKKYAETYYRLLVKIGREARVFLIPDELDRDPQCLPPNVGLEAISDNVRSPVFDKLRHEAIPIRNQAMLEKRNDILPCTLDHQMYAPLYLHLIPLGFDELLQKIDFYLDALEKSPAAVSNIYLTSIAELRGDIENLKKIDFTIWLSDPDLSKNDKINLVLQDMQYETSVIRRMLRNRGEEQHLDDFEAITAKAAYFVDYILDVYKFMTSTPSFDCCELHRKPLPDYSLVAFELRTFLIPFLKTTANNLENDEYITSKLIYITSALMLHKAVVELFNQLTLQRQMICFEGPKPDLRKYALDLINQKTGLELKDLGVYEYKRLSIAVEGGKNMEFRFGECFCGKARETNLPFLQLTPGEQSFTHFKHLKLTKFYEVSAGYGMEYLSPRGADKYHGNASLYFSKLDTFYDSLIMELYSSAYSFKDLHDFVFTSFNTFNVSLSRQLFRNTFFRINYSGKNGEVNATLPFSYLKDPVYPETKTDIEGLYLSKISVRSIGLSGRYHFGRRLSPYLGAGYNYLIFRNTFSRAYVNQLEFALETFENMRSYNLFMEGGLRYNINIDFFIEAGASLNYRNDKDFNSNRVNGLDYGLYLLAGTRF